MLVNKRHNRAFVWVEDMFRFFWRGRHQPEGSDWGSSGWEIGFLDQYSSSLPVRLPKILLVCDVVADCRIFDLKIPEMQNAFSSTIVKAESQEKHIN